MIAAFMVLHFAICGPAEPACERGFTVARTCEQAERGLRAGLRPQQRLIVHRCVPWDQREWARE